MPEKDATFWQTVLLWGGIVLTWAGGEAGRVLVAGASGGIFRWFMSQRRRMRDGALAVITGVMAAKYMSPVALAMIEATIGPMRDETDIQATAAFAAGLGGMSVAKVVIAVFENQATRLRGDRNDG
ncbi:hypothetical protein DDZ14_08585 [Maritimibacter sp. 55A14]|uniref:hypothetical protein n=1 Tax=Maritimibacter sp. 55A14 TaxID=2174844 RepID=UPI000D614978|nr:hypothetical protein [Maritimibacter sp. 55A14]PWE32793.1 hypothetical protein DDZ14_08585 [Maritimibacter sp. 55A14]